MKFSNNLMRGFFFIPVFMSYISCMDMDMDHKEEDSLDIVSSTQAVDYSTIIPVPHEVHHLHGVPILETKLTPAERLYWENYNTTTYFTLDTPYKSNLYIHLFLIIGSFIFFYPIVLILNNINSAWYLPAFLIHATVTIISLFNYMIFIKNVPDLYPKNAYTKMGVGLFVMTVMQIFAATIYVASKWLSGPEIPKSEFIPLNNYSDEQENPGHASPSSTLYEFNDSNHAQVSNDSFELESNPTRDHYPVKPANMHPDSELHHKSKIAEKRDSMLQKFFDLPLISLAVRIFGGFAYVLFNLLNFGLFLYFLVYLPTGVAVLNLIGKDEHVFNVLAHFIKGGIFFSLGIVSLARYSGGFKKLGWAWNYSYITKYEKNDSIWFKLQPLNSMLTMEMMESLLIFIYGSTNVFLEHLASPGGEWTPKDLQHVSIAFMYFGAGLCGIITEVKLDNWRKHKALDAIEKLEDNQIDKFSIVNVTPGFSPNPFPVFTIFWTGVLMSQHAQASALSTQVHVQWGSLLAYGSFFRVFTALLMIFSPVSYRALFEPTRPFTELISSFCLLAGGLVFMESTDPVISALEFRGLTPMFTLNVSVGCIALVMAWIMCVFAIKDWLKSRFGY